MVVDPQLYHGVSAGYMLFGKLSVTYWWFYAVRFLCV